MRKVAITVENGVCTYEGANGTHTIKKGETLQPKPGCTAAHVAVKVLEILPATEFESVRLVLQGKKRTSARLVSVLANYAVPFVERVKPTPKAKPTAPASTHTAPAQVDMTVIFAEMRALREHSNSEMHALRARVERIEMLANAALSHGTMGH